MSDKKFRTPVISSATDFFRNTSSGFMFGFTGDTDYINPTKGRGTRGTPFHVSIDDAGKRKWDPQFSVGGTLSAYGGIIGGGAVGAGAGALASNFIPGANPIPMALGGLAVGAIGAAALPVAAGGAAKAGLSILQNTDKILGGIGTAAMGVLGAAGKAIRSTVATSIPGLKFGAQAGSIASSLSPINRYAGVAAGLVSKMVKMNEPISVKGLQFDDASLSKFGVAAVAGTALISGVSKGFNEFMNIKTGQRDNYVTNNAPRMNYMDNAGATGDLVFALNANRQG